MTNRHCFPRLGTAAILVSSIFSAEAGVWETAVPGGVVRFDDWGYSGPQGQNALQFDWNGFQTPALIQHVVTSGPDRITPDAPVHIFEDLSAARRPLYPYANMDSQVNFYKWGYTTVAGSTFSNMKVDYDGDYLIARKDMAFRYYGVFDYKYDPLPGSPPPVNPPPADGVYPTNVGFQPYALSDATGWCGALAASHPMANEAMAGQVTFDFGFEAFLPSSPPGQVPGTGSMQIVPDFIMRSYGTIQVDIKQANGGPADFLWTAHAVVANTDPASAPTGEFSALVPAGPADNNPYYGHVSFMGAGVVPEFAWVLVADRNAPMSNENILAVLDEDADGNPIIPLDPSTGLPLAGDVLHHRNSFANYPFLLRADADRSVDAIDKAFFADVSNVPPGALDSVRDLNAVPIPAAVWLFGPALAGLLSLRRRKGP